MQTEINIHLITLILILNAAFGYTLLWCRRGFQPLNIKNKRYLCYQQMVMKEELIGTTNNITLETVIRNVGAKNQEEAIGKFVVETNKIQAQKKLEPVCFLLDNLTKID